MMRLYNLEINKKKNLIIKNNNLKKYKQKKKKYLKLKKSKIQNIKEILPKLQQQL